MNNAKRVLITGASAGLVLMLSKRWPKKAIPFTLRCAV